MSTVDIGTRLGPYEITGKLGEGGMGEVWRATDARLKREVALKVLPAAFVADPERLARFEREAQLLAQLHHPNIAAIHGLEDSGGVRALVMELVEGPTLEERLAPGALPVEECVAIARQVAEALEEAHEKGIVHRDLKPANVKVTPDGKVKVLDFGLAKAMDATASGVGSSPADLARSPTLMHSPTLTAAHGTQLGVILGTAAYMAPEQARGAAVDKRADVWAFGVILYEMLTGRRLFAGDTVSDVLAAVLRADVDTSALPADTPPAVRRVLRRCLERNPRLRLRDIGEARVALDPASAALEERVAPPAAIAAPRASRALQALPWVLVVLLAAGTAWLWRRGDAGATVASARTTVLALRLPGGMAIPLDNRGIYGQTGVLAIARDGSRVAFVEGSIGKGALYVRELDGAEYHQIEGTTAASSPFFSPDGRWIGFFSPGKLRKVSIDGGRPVDLATTSLDRGAVWCPDGSIVYAGSATAGLMRLSPGGGAPQELTHLDVAHGERTHRWPAVLPGGREVAFTIGVIGQPGNYDDSTIGVVDLATGKRRTLLRGASMVRFTPDGMVLLARESQVLALPLAAAHGQSAEDAPVVLRNVSGVPASGVSHFDVAADGTLVYAELDPRAEELELAWYSREGVSTPLTLPKAPYRLLRLAPDGKRLAMAVGAGADRGGDIWILDLATGGANKLTFDGHSWYPAWTRDGSAITYVVTLASGAEEIRTRLADGSRPAELVAHFDAARARGVIGWAADGSLLVTQDDGGNGAGNFYSLPPGGGAARPYIATPAVELQPALSPDGRFVAYAADSTGRSDLFVQPYPPTGAKWLVAEGAGAPLWSADGREIYYVTGRELRVVPVTTRPSFEVGASRRLFDFPVAALVGDDTATSYAVAPDGRVLASRNASSEVMNDHLVVVLNWFAKLRGVVAGGR